MNIEFDSTEDLLSQMYEEHQIRSQKLSLLQSTIEGVDNEIEAVKAEIWARISKKSQLLEKQIELLGKIRELDMMHDGDDNNNTGSNPQQQEYPNFPVQSHSLMVSGNFASQPTELVVGYFEQFGRIIKLTDKSGYRVNSKTGYRFVFLKYDRVEAVDMAVDGSPHRINGNMYLARRGKDY